MPSAGTFQVGSGGHYADWAAAIASITSPLTGDLTFEQISDVVNGPSASKSPIDCGTHTLTFKNTSPHVGNPNAGYKTYQRSTGVLIYLYNITNGKVVVRDLNIKVDGGSGVTYGGTVWMHAGLDADLDVHDLIIVNVNRTYAGSGASVVQVRPQTGATGTTQVNIWNLVTVGFSAVSGVDEDIDSNRYATLANILIENCTSIAGPNGINANSTVMTLQNNCVVGADGTCFVGIGSATGNNNASEDPSADDGNWSGGAGSNNNTSVYSGTEFVSIDPTNSNLARVTNAGVCGAGGTTPLIPGNTAGIRGNARASSIGADEYALPGPSGGGGAGSGGGISGAITAAMAAGY